MKVYSNPKLLPLELWHGLTPWGPLHKSEERHIDAIAFFLRQLHQGEAQTLSHADTKKLKPCRGFQKVVLTGGRARKIYESLCEQEFPFELSFLDESHSTQGPRLERTGTKTLLDWGQTSLKIIEEDSIQVIPRDHKMFPFIENEHVPSQEARKRIETFLTNLLRTLNLKYPICVALPVEFQGENLLPSTYQGLEGPLSEIFSRIPELQGSVFLNDAVLAALGVSPR
jgi:hypothetical protein